MLKKPTANTSRTELLVPCEGPCGRITRPTRWPAEKFPGTVIRASGGRCHKCRDLLEDRPAPPPRDRSVPPETLENIAAGLERWQARRRRDAERLRARHLTY